MKQGKARFWYRFKNWFRTKPGPGEPLRFLCGAEEELRRVTTWFCHISPHVFDRGGMVLVDYPVPIGTVAGCGGLEGVVDDNGYICQFSCSEYDYGLKWSACVYKFNTYEGTEWSEPLYLFPVWELYEKLFPERRQPMNLFSEWRLPIPGSCVEGPVKFRIEVFAPSAHERAEALLALSEWLDGKVSDEEKRELLELPDDVEI